MLFKIKTRLIIVLKAGSLFIVCIILTTLLRDQLESCKKCFRQLEVELNVSRTLPTQHKKFCFYNYLRGEPQNIENVLTNVGYKSGPDSPNWDFMFTFVIPEKLNAALMTLKPNQKINWFKRDEISYYVNKLLLALTLRTEPFIPLIFLLPEEKELLLKFLKENPEQRVVRKRIDHRGVKVINSTVVDAVSNVQFVQKFISNPLLVGGHKFELGVYAVVTSMDPLRVYIYNGDISLRFCPKKYNPFHPEDLDRYVVADHYKPIWEMPELYKLYYTGFGQRISLITYFKSIGIDIGPVWGRFEEIITKVFSLNTAGGTHNNNFFELVRCDFLIDDNLNVFLLECNISPNLSSKLFPNNQLLFEQLIYSLFGLTGLAVRFKKNTLALSLDESRILASDRDISVFPEFCNGTECHSCENKTAECIFCANCLTYETKEFLKRAYTEHVNIMNFKRLWPPKMNSLKPDDLPEYFQTLSARNQIMYKWYLGKCLLDDTWC